MKRRSLDDFGVQLETYRDAVSRRLWHVCGITWGDACGDVEPLVSALNSGETPEEFVDWFVAKYDLDRLEALWLKPRPYPGE